jgi:hypothetical protein
VYEWRNGRSRPEPQRPAPPQPSVSWMSVRLITTTESSQHSNFDVRRQCCPGIRPKRVVTRAPHRGTANFGHYARQHNHISASMRPTNVGKRSPQLPASGLTPCTRGQAWAVGCRCPDSGRTSTPSAPRSPSAPPTWGQLRTTRLMILLEAEPMLFMNRGIT